jgi:hypothetical protein
MIEIDIIHDEHNIISAAIRFISMSHIVALQNEHKNGDRV